MLGKILNFLFPFQCVICGRISGKQLVCNQCASAMLNISVLDTAEPNQSHCKICSRPLVSENLICTSCRSREFSFEKNISLWDYKEENVQAVIHAYKFKNKKNLSYFFANALFTVYKQFYSRLPVIPAPCSKNRLKKYGWDHMSAVAKILSSDYKIPVFNVFKKRKTRDQKKLNFKERQTELINKIYIPPKNIEQLAAQYSEVVIIDDVFTTGATVNYCADLLLKEGIKKIFALTFALD